MSKILIEIKDPLNTRYLSRRSPGETWALTSATEVPLCLSYVADEAVKLRAQLDDATSAEQAVAILKQHGRNPTTQYSIVVGSQPSAVPRPLTDEIPASDGEYGRGFRDAVESMSLALQAAGLDQGVLAHIQQSALDAYANNVGDAPLRSEAMSAEEGDIKVALGKALTVLVDLDRHPKVCEWPMFLEGGNATQAIESLRKCLPEWTNEYAAAALAEGWILTECHGSQNGPWQIQKVDDVTEWPLPNGGHPPELATDYEALTLVANGTEPHHEAARRFLAVMNPPEHRLVERFRERETHAATAVLAPGA